ncbi:hypothetical protein TEA_008786 [Camellia sinensis var. sinensis]|uniref:non-specific serine/threonine protein kinase n=1 Tax=Camellia sinensis var. sinensis TaxID=542762 RepID=A0A4S4EFV9_CAMSN|nr:hypothetical protein TEA_008786 [Camellia sinensis var. sinensis]
MLPFKRLFPEYSTEASFEDNLNQVKLEELPLFKFEKLAIATNEFNWTNKLGQGGFGPGKLPDGQEIAVKRLSRSSEQGLEEFMNEVVMISKLQHRNLVRLLGCCVEGKEKMLVYEYMPNKSLDAFLFDPQKQKLLDWSKRFDIIEGIGRGLLYLHRDSRLRIIHRDLKTSNILLDEELNPKILDFGMARIFCGEEHQANTRRVVGTYGYMSPEYAMQGLFSEKSDVFSFGVLLLEIVSGRRNTSFYDDEHSLSLLGYAWKLWNEDNIVTLIDPMISYQDFRSEILRCVNVGLLCVQEFAIDRPTISTVLSMLNSEISYLPRPKQPAFTQTPKSLSSQESLSRCSRNELTVTIVDGRESCSSVDSEEFEPEALVDSGVANRQDNSKVKTVLEEAHRVDDVMVNVRGNWEFGEGNDRLDPILRRRGEPGNKLKKVLTSVDDAVLTEIKTTLKYFDCPNVQKQGRAAHILLRYELTYTTFSAADNIPIPTGEQHHTTLVFPSFKSLRQIGLETFDSGQNLEPVIEVVVESIREFAAKAEEVDEAQKSVFEAVGRNQPDSPSTSGRVEFSFGDIFTDLGDLPGDFSEDMAGKNLTQMARKRNAERMAARKKMEAGRSEPAPVESLQPITEGKTAQVVVDETEKEAEQQITELVPKERSEKRNTEGDVGSEDSPAGKQP